MRKPFKRCFVASLDQMERSGRNYHKVGFKGREKVGWSEGGESDNKQFGVVVAIAGAAHRLSVRYPEAVRRMIHLRT